MCSSSQSTAVQTEVDENGMTEIQANLCILFADEDIFPIAYQKNREAVVAVIETLDELRRSSKSVLGTRACRGWWQWACWQASAFRCQLPSSSNCHQAILKSSKRQKFCFLFFKIWISTWNDLTLIEAHRSMKFCTPIGALFVDSDWCQEVYEMRIGYLSILVKQAIMTHCCRELSSKTI